MLGDGGGSLLQVCDDDPAIDTDPAPGMIALGNVPEGDYLLIESQAPPGYEPGPDQPVSITSGQTAFVSVFNSPIEMASGQLMIEKIGPVGEPLSGTCFALFDLSSSANLLEGCDNAAGDMHPEPGVILFGQVPVGSYRLIETQPPPGYQSAPEQVVTIEVAQTTSVIVPNGALAAPASAAPVAARDAY